MSNFENYDFILPDGVVIENEKADKEGRKKRMSAMCVKVREQTNMNRKEFAEWLGIPYRTMQDWERGVSEVPDYVLNLIAYKVKNEKEKGNSDFLCRRDGLRKLRQEDREEHCFRERCDRSQV